MRITKLEMSEKVSRMRADPQILTRAASETARIYKTHPRVVRKVRSMIVSGVTNHGPETLRQAASTVVALRLEKSLSRTAEKYPGLLFHLFRKTLSETGDLYGLRKQRIHQIEVQVRRYATLKRTHPEAVCALFDPIAP